MDKKIRVLWFSDSPVLCSTGFGKVAHNLVKRLHATGKYEFKFLSVNLQPADVARRATEVNEYGINIPCLPNPDNNPYNQKKLAEMIMKEDFDILVTFQDTFILKESWCESRPIDLGGLIRRVRKTGKAFRWVEYFPIDGTPHADWLEHLKECDAPVAFNKYGVDEVLKVLPGLKDKIQCVYHGINTDEFYPLSDEERDEFRASVGLRPEDFFVVRVDRNQQRKDIPRTMAIFSKFHAKHPDSKLYLHCAPQDSATNLRLVGKRFGLEEGKNLAFPKNFSVHYGVPIEQLNKIYNAADVVMSTTLGEGCGLSSLEAMACRRPILFPDNSALSETLSNNRGVKMDCKGWFILPFDNEILRPLTDVKDGAQKLEKLWKDKQYRDRIAKNGYDWVITMTWDKAAAEFDRIISEQYEGLQNQGPVVQSHSAVHFNPDADRMLFIGKHYDPPRNEHEVIMQGVLKEVSQTADVYAICDSDGKGELFEDTEVITVDNVTVIREPLMLSNLSKYVEAVSPNIIVTQAEGIEVSIFIGKKLNIPVAVYLVDLGHFCPTPHALTSNLCKGRCSQCQDFAQYNFAKVRSDLARHLDLAEFVFANKSLEPVMVPLFKFNHKIEYVEGIEELAEKFKQSLLASKEINMDSVKIKGRIL